MTESTHTTSMMMDDDENNTSPSPSPSPTPNQKPMMKSHYFANLFYSIYARMKQTWKPLLLGQLLSVLLAGSGAANETLQFDCNLSAPSLQVGLIYFFLSFYSIALMKENCRGCGEGGSRGSRGSRIRNHDNNNNEHHRNSRQLSTEDIDEAYIAATYENNERSSRLGTLFGQCFGNSINRYISCVQSQSKWCLCFPIEGSLKMYFLIAFLDLQANYFTVLAFRYTTLTSVSLLDALAIPSAMFFSRFMLRRCYSSSHIVGAAVCILGVTVNIFSDYEGGSQNENYGQGDDNENGDDNGDDGEIENDYPFQVSGDLLAITGAIIYGLNNVLTERAVKQIGGIKEYLAMIGLFGSLIAIVQGLILDRSAVMDFFDADAEICSASKGFGILLLTGLLGLVSYTGMSTFLSESEAAFLSLSLLTGDLWAAAFSIVAQGILPTFMFWIALVLIFIGVIVYELSGSPIVDDDENENLSDNRLIRRRNGGITAQHLRELEMPHEML
jgi:solute carrier family 35 protein F1/2